MQTLDLGHKIEINNLNIFEKFKMKCKLGVNGLHFAYYEACYFPLSKPKTESDCMAVK